MNSNKGFTLIEILVVVLIIGILAAIAVPQYKLAVEKSRAKLMLAVMEDISKAENLYKLANGQYTANFQDLDIDLPYTNISKDKSQIRTPDGIYYGISFDGSYPHVMVTPGHWNFQLYRAFSWDLYICYPQNNDLGRKVCRNLGCPENELNNQYCYFSNK